MKHSGVEAEYDGEHIVGESRRQRTERAHVARLLDRTLRIEVELVEAGTCDEGDVGHGSIPMDEEPHYRAHGRVPGRLETHRDLPDDVVQIPLIRELDPLGPHRRDVGATSSSGTAARL